MPALSISEKSDCVVLITWPMGESLTHHGMPWQMVCGMNGM
jgi:hypothetical protein